MVTEASRKVGSIDCCMCGESMPVRENGRGTLNLSCPWCGHSSYAKPGTEAHRIASGWLRKDAPASAPEAAPEATPAAAISVAKLAKAARGFSLGDL